MNKIIIRVDGRDQEFEYASKEHFDALNRVHAAEVANLTTAHAKTIEDLKGEHKVKLDALTAERDGHAQQLEVFKADLKEKEKAIDEKKAKEDDEYKRTRSARRQLERHAFRLLSRVKPDDEEEGDEDEKDGDEGKMPFKKSKREKKLDAFLDTASDREIMERVIKSLPGGEKFDAKDKDDGYVRVRYDMVMESVGQTLGNGITDVVATIKQSQERVDNFDSADSPLAEMSRARTARDEAAAKAGHAFGK
jgi:hypothetical protein